MTMKFKSVYLFLKILSSFILLRPFGKIIYDIGGKHDISIQQLRKYERLKIKSNKRRLDINFLKNCEHFDVRPNFIKFDCYVANNHDKRFIEKKLLKSAIRRNEKEDLKIKKLLRTLEDELRGKLSSLDFYILHKAVMANVKRDETTIIKQHNKKLSRLTENYSPPYTANDVIRNFSTYQPNQEEEELLKYGLNYAIPLRAINNTDILATFETMRAMKVDLKSEASPINLKSQMSFLVNLYVCNKPSKTH